MRGLRVHGLGIRVRGLRFGFQTLARHFRARFKVIKWPNPNTSPHQQPWYAIKIRASSRSGLGAQGRARDTLLHAVAVERELEDSERLKADEEKHEVADNDELAEGRDIAGGRQVLRHHELDRRKRKEEGHHGACTRVLQGLA